MERDKNYPTLLSSHDRVYATIGVMYYILSAGY